MGSMGTARRVTAQLHGLRGNEHSRSSLGSECGTAVSIQYAPAKSKGNIRPGKSRSVPDCTEWEFIRIQAIGEHLPFAQPVSPNVASRPPYPHFWEPGGQSYVTALQIRVARFRMEGLPGV